MKITIVKARFLRFTGVPRETAKSELLDGLGRFGRSQAGSALGPSKPGKVRFPASSGQDAGNRGLGRVPKPGPRGPQDAQKEGAQTPPFGPQAHYRPGGLLGPIPETEVSGIGPRGPSKGGLGFGDLSFGHPRFGAPDPNRSGVSGTEVGEPEVDFGRDPEKDPIRRPDSEVGLGAPFGRGPKPALG